MSKTRPLAPFHPRRCRQYLRRKPFAAVRLSRVISRSQTLDCVIWSLFYLFKISHIDNSQKLQNDCPLNIFGFFSGGKNLRGRYAPWLRDWKCSLRRPAICDWECVISFNSFDQWQGRGWTGNIRLSIAVTCFYGGCITDVQFVFRPRSRL